MDQIIERNMDQMEPPAVGNSLFENRTAMAEMRQTSQPEVSILITAFNRLEKTRRCVESVLANTTGIHYELILLDNGSTDGTLEYFKSIPFQNKKIIHISKNLGAGNAILDFTIDDFGNYICSLANDIIVTPHWMENLLVCMKSDPRIGMVNPVSSNTSNLQDVGLTFKSYQEMQAKAGRFNRSDPHKWEDRQRLITLGTLYRKEVLLAGGWPLSDMGFFHDFIDDDVTFKIRRLGYRTVLAGDTWICHDHDLRSGEGKDPVEFQQSLTIGRENFREKYFGVDAWEDVNNYYIPYLKHFPPPSIKTSARVLGVDVRCGTPILDVKNWLRKAGIFQTELSAFTQDPKYWVDLKTICSGPVFCDREEFLADAFLPGYFDYVIADRPLNRYHEPQKILDDLFMLCKSGGIVACKLKNTFSFQEYAHLLGQWDIYDREYAYPIPVETINRALSILGTVRAVIAVPFDLNEDSRQVVNSLIPEEFPENRRSELLHRMLCREYLFITEKR